MLTKLEGYWKAVAAALGSAAIVANELLPILPAADRPYVTTVLAVLTALGVYQVPSMTRKHAAKVARKRVTPPKTGA